MNMENKEINPADENAKPSAIKTLLIRFCCLIPSILLIAFGIYRRWEMRGMKLLFMDSDLGSSLRNWWVPVLIGVLFAVILVIRWILADHLGRGKSDPDKEENKSSEAAVISESEKLESTPLLSESANGEAVEKDFDGQADKNTDKSESEEVTEEKAAE